LLKSSERKKELAPYEDFVRDRLKQYPDTSSAQMHDWLKENHEGFPKLNPKTVFNFVHFIRNKHNIPKLAAQRQMAVVEELPYGKQAQVDFGEYIMRSSTGSRVKVFFFIMVLSRSRYKYVWFTDRYFTSELAIEAHELAFAFIRGVPDEIVYDQDKVFIVSENSGDIILTELFRNYTRHQSFTLHFCRKADPQSKGKVENVVKYVKQNFLYNRTFYNIETLNDDALGWLGRTANAVPHSFTKKDPITEWHIEQGFLKPYAAQPRPNSPLSYTVRKDNTISWKGNLYSLPLGTYTGRGSQVSVQIQQGELVFLQAEGKELCRHKISTGKGLKIINSDHKRDKTSAIGEMIDQLCALLQDPQTGKDWLATIRTAKPRYARDQLLLVRQAIGATDPTLIERTVRYCLDNHITRAVDFKAILLQQQLPPVKQKKVIPLNPLSGIPWASTQEPEKSSVQDYEDIIKKLTS
ncbi:MAG: transposase, partial [Chloroflexi bacterium]|nr:transposase [Chloroflexota bacterium]